MSTSSPLIDTHCHLDYDYDGKPIDQVIRAAFNDGVEFLMTIGTTVENAPIIAGIAERFEQVFFTVGVHPHDTQTVSADYLDVLKTHAQHPKCRGIGEIGLDYYYEHSNREAQKLRLKEQLDLANQMGLPVVIHSRDGEDDLLAALTLFVQNRKSGRPPGVIHCFSGSADFAKKCLDLGFYISFSGILTFKKSQDLRQIAQSVPLDRALVETDAPFLAPEPMRGRKCEPAMVVHTARKLAQIHGLTFEEVARATTNNAKALFSLP